MIGIWIGSTFIAGATLGSIGVLIALCVAFVRLPATRSAQSIAFGAFLVATAAFGMWRMPVTGSEPAEVGAGPLQVDAIVESFPLPAREGQRFVARIGEVDSTVRFCVQTEVGPAVERGQTVRIDGQVANSDTLTARERRILASRRCEAGFEADRLTIVQRESGTRRLGNTVRARIAITFQRVAPGDTGVLMTGLVTGDDSAFSFGAREAFLSTGTTHITAVSGANFALVAAAAAVLAGSPGRRRRLVWIFSTSLVIWGYAFVVGLPPSALRAAGMATLAMVALRFGRRPDLLTLVALFGAAHIAVRPHDLASLSFQLSYVSTLALVLVFSGSVDRGDSLPVSIVLASIAAHFATIPILAYHIGEFAPATVPANIAITPFVLVAFPLSALGAVVGVLSPSLGAAVSIPGALMTSSLRQIVEAMAHWMPGRVIIGDARGLPLFTMAAACWLVIGLLSADVRVAVGAVSRNAASLGTSRRNAAAALACGLLAGWMLARFVG
jgi:ComEC/Rec2-related protein